MHGWCWVPEFALLLMSTIRSDVDINIRSSCWIQMSNKRIWQQCSSLQLRNGVTVSHVNWMILAWQFDTINRRFCNGCSSGFQFKWLCSSRSSTVEHVMIRSESQRDLTRPGHIAGKWNRGLHPSKGMNAREHNIWLIYGFSNNVVGSLYKSSFLTRGSGYS